MKICKKIIDGHIIFMNSNMRRYGVIYKAESNQTSIKLFFLIFFISSKIKAIFISKNQHNCSY